MAGGHRVAVASSLGDGEVFNDSLRKLRSCAALERAEAKVLLLGAGFSSCTTFHLAEYRIPDPPTSAFGGAVRTPAGREWITYTDVDTSSDDFESLGADYERTGAVTRGTIGEAECRLFPVRSAVEVAVGWLAGNR